MSGNLVLIVTGTLHLTSEVKFYVHWQENKVCLFLFLADEGVGGRKYELGGSS